MNTPKYSTKKLAVLGVTAGLVAGAGAGLLMNLPGGASAKSPVAVSATDTGTDTGAPASSIVGAAGDVEGAHHGGRHGGGHGGRHADPAKREAKLREVLQALVDDGTLEASDLDAIVTALTTRPSTPPADVPADDGTRPERGERLATALQALVDDGTLTASQRDAVVAALEAARPADGGRHGGRHGGLRGEMLDTAATAIGITADELKTEIQAGKTIAEVAVANGKTAQDVIDALVATASADLTQRITDMVNGVHPEATDSSAAPAEGA